MSSPSQISSTCANSTSSSPSLLYVNGAQELPANFNMAKIIAGIMALEDDDHEHIDDDGAPDTGVKYRKDGTVIQGCRGSWAIFLHHLHIRNYDLPDGRYSCNLTARIYHSLPIEAREKLVRMEMAARKLHKEKYPNFDAHTGEELNERKMKKTKKPRSPTPLPTLSTSGSGNNAPEMPGQSPEREVLPSTLSDFHEFVRYQIPGLLKWWQVPENRAIWMLKRGASQEEMKTRTIPATSFHRATPYDRPVTGSPKGRFSRQSAVARRQELRTGSVDVKGKGKAKAMDDYEYPNVPPRLISSTANDSDMIQFNSGQVPNSYAQMGQVGLFQDYPLAGPSNSTPCINSGAEPSLILPDYSEQSMDRFLTSNLAQSSQLGPHSLVWSNMENMNDNYEPDFQTAHVLPMSSYYSGPIAEPSDFTQQFAAGLSDPAQGVQYLPTEYPQPLPDNVNDEFVLGQYQNFDIV